MTSKLIRGGIDGRWSRVGSARGHGEGREEGRLTKLGHAMLLRLMSDRRRCRTSIPLMLRVVRWHGNLEPLGYLHDDDGRDGHLAVLVALAHHALVFGEDNDGRQYDGGVGGLVAGEMVGLAGAGRTRGGGERVERVVVVDVVEEVAAGLMVRVEKGRRGSVSRLDTRQRR
jgi:hypothetical protein